MTSSEKSELHASPRFHDSTRNRSADCETTWVTVQIGAIIRCSRGDDRGHYPTLIRGRVEMGIESEDSVGIPNYYASIFHGFTSATPMPSKSLTFRVTNVIRRVKAIAAI